MLYSEVHLKSMRWFPNLFSLIPPKRVICVKEFFNGVDSNDFSSVSVIVDPWPSDLFLLLVIEPFIISHLPA